MHAWACCVIHSHVTDGIFFLCDFGPKPHSIPQRDEQSHLIYVKVWKTLIIFFWVIWRAKRELEGNLQSGDWGKGILLDCSIHLFSFIVKLHIPWVYNILEADSLNRFNICKHHAQICIIQTALNKQVPVIRNLAAIYSYSVTQQTLMSMTLGFVGNTGQWKVTWASCLLSKLLKEKCLYPQ